MKGDVIQFYRCVELLKDARWLTLSACSVGLFPYDFILTQYVIVCQSIRYKLQSSTLHVNIQKSRYRLKKEVVYGSNSSAYN